MKQIYIMLTQVGTLISKSIKLYTKAKYNHSSVGIDPDLKVFYSFARRVRYLPMIGGFITEVINEGMFKRYPHTECAIYTLTVDDATYNRFCAVLERYQNDSRKYRYNLLGLFGCMFNKPFYNEYRNTCAEFIAKLLHESGIYTFKKHFSLVRPDELPCIPRLYKLYEGPMRELDIQRAV